MAILDKQSGAIVATNAFMSYPLCCSGFAAWAQPEDLRRRQSDQLAVERDLLLPSQIGAASVLAALTRSHLTPTVTNW